MGQQDPAARIAELEQQNAALRAELERVETGARIAQSALDEALRPRDDA